MQFVFVRRNPILNVKIYDPDQSYWTLKPLGQVRAKAYDFKLDQFQNEAIQCIENNQSVLVSAHTSAGKTVIAEYAIAHCLNNGRHAIYTAPIKALSNEKFRGFTDQFGNVGIVTGDGSTNDSASCLIMTTEILREKLYHDKDQQFIDKLDWVVFDEAHFIGHKERGLAWEESIILLPSRVRCIFLSATMSNAREICAWIAHARKQNCHMIYTGYRPTPLDYHIFPAGDGPSYLVVDGNGNFKYRIKTTVIVYFFLIH